MINIVLAEDQAMIRGALATLLALESDIAVLGAAENGDIAWQMVGELAPDILVTDIEMPGLTGLELAARVAKDRPATKVVIVTTFGRPGFLERALRAHVAAYVLKDAPVETLAETLRRVQRGERVIDPELAVAAASERDPLTDRERQVLRLAGQGHDTEAIARTLHLATGTVRNYLSEAIAKLDATNRIEAYRLAQQKGWL